MNNQWGSEEYWEQAWKNDPNTSLKKMKRTGMNSYQSKGFEKWATQFNATSFSADGVNRTERIMKWVEQQTGAFDLLSILDVGAASGVFSIPFSKKGAAVHALEPSSILAEMMEKNAKQYDVTVNIINQSFEEINEKEHGGFDLVFASMCPAMSDWKAVKKAISCADKYVYISLMAGAKQNKLIEELMIVLDVEGTSISSDMYYLLQLLYINDYSYQSLIEKHEKTVMMNRDEVREGLKAWFLDYDIELDDEQFQKAVEYLKETYGKDVPVTTGGKFGKVLIHL